MERIIWYKTLRIWMRVEGQGPAVMLLHGFGGDHSIWDLQVDALKKHYTVIMPDLPGIGLSDRMEKATVEELSDALKFVYDELASALSMAGQVVVIGHSMGGYIALAFAHRYPGHVKGLGLFHSTALPDSEEKKANRFKNIDFIHRHGSAAYVQQSMPPLFSNEFLERHPEMVEAVMAPSRHADPRSLVTLLQAMMNRPDHTDLLVTSPYPVLLVAGEHDKIIPIDSVLQQSHMPQCAYIHILDRAGHMGMIEQPIDSAHILLTYLQDVSTPN